MYSFSVVMSVYSNDNLDYLIQSVDSVLNQTLPPNEFVIVIDGAISEKKIEYLRSLNHENIDFKLVELKENGGLANALNIGIKNAKYEVIARMDADDICFKDRFEKQINFFVRNDLDVLGGQLHEFEIDLNNIVSKRIVPVVHDEIVKRMKYLNPFSHPSVIFHKKVFDKLVGYDVNIFPEDYDFFVRAYLAGFKLGNLKDPVVYYRLGNNNENSMFSRRRGVNFAMNEYKLYKKFYKLGFYNIFEFVFFTSIKLPVRLLPVKTFKLVYNILTR